MTSHNGVRARKKDYVWDRNPPAPNTITDLILNVYGLRRHGPTQVFRADVVAEAHSRSYSYGVFTPFQICGPGIQNVPCPTSTTGC